MRKLLILNLFAALTSVGAVNFPMGTYIVTGTVMNYKHEALRANSEATVQAVSSSGAILASCRVADPAENGVNYALQIPISTTSSAESAAIGDIVRCAVVSAAGVTNIAPAALPPIPAANAIARVNFVSASTTSFAYSDPSSVQVADDYLAALTILMHSRGISAYSATDDWDGDGADNYSEYVAGTNPFDATDYLRFTDIKVADREVELSFEYSGGHLYTLYSSSGKTGSSLPWEKETTVTAEGTDEDVDIMTIYLAPATPVSSLYKIGVE